MGAPIHENSVVGRRAMPLKRRLNLVIRRIESNPPKGVVAATHGGKNHVSVRGYIGRRLYWYAVENRTEFQWSHENTAAGFIRGLTLHNRFGQHKQLDVLEKLLPVLEHEFPRIERPMTTEHASGHQEAEKGTGQVVEQDELSQLEKPSQRPTEAPAVDPEVAAIDAVRLALEQLDIGAKRRVIAYVSDRFLSD